MSMLSSLMVLESQLKTRHLKKNLTTYTKLWLNILNMNRVNFQRFQTLRNIPKTISTSIQTFLAKLKAASMPLDCDFINYVEDWLVQHIMNTDFAYKGKLIHEVPEPYIWEPSFQ